MPKRVFEISKPSDSGWAEVEAKELTPLANRRPENLEPVEIEAALTASISPEMEEIFAEIQAKSDAIKNQKIMAENIQTLIAEIQAEIATFENPRDFSQECTSILINNLNIPKPPNQMYRFNRESKLSMIHELLKRLDRLNKNQKARLFLKCSRYFEHMDLQKAYKFLELIVNDEELASACGAKKHFIQKMAALKAKADELELSS